MKRTVLSALSLVALLIAAPAAAQTTPQAATPLIAAADVAPATAAKAPAPRIARHASLVDVLPTPAYPVKARQFGVEGSVRIAYTVDAEGRPQQFEVLDGPGYGCDEEALRVLRLARFTPAVDLAGRPVARRYVTTFVFQLGDR